MALQGMSKLDPPVSPAVSHAAHKHTDLDRTLLEWYLRGFMSLGAQLLR